MICPRCKTENKDGTKFCTACGNPLSIQAGPQQMNPQQMGPQQMGPQQMGTR